MEQLLDDDHLKSQHQRKGSRQRVKRNYDKNSLLLHSAKLHKLSKQLFQLKVIKSNNRTTAQFFSTTCYRRLKIPKRRRQLNVIRVVIFFLLLLFVYLYWWHRTRLGSESADEYLSKNYRTSNGEVNSYQENINLKQIDVRPNRKDDQKDRENDFLERQHLFSVSTTSDRSFLKLDFNARHNSELHAAYTPISANKTGEHNDQEIQNNDHTRLSVLSTSLLLPAQQTRASNLNPQSKDHSFQATTTKPLVSKSNQSVFAYFPIEQRKNRKSILEKQLAWYELVGVTMFNLLGSTLVGQNISNKRFKNHSNAITKIQSNVETTLSKPFASSIRSPSIEHISAGNQTSSDHQKLNLTKSLPQCIIIGVRKAGTRAVLEWMTLNDRIRKADNEVHFFDNDERYALGLDYYRDQMPLSAQGQITIEKSPAYFVTALVPERISRSMNKTIKLILIVRDPVIRLISDYTQLISKQLAQNKLLKLDDLMRTSGSTKQQQHSEAMQNYLPEFPVDKQEKNRLATTRVSTNEQSAFVVADLQAEHNHLERMKIEKAIDEHIAKQQLSSLASDYLNRIGSEFDYRKGEQLDEDDELDEEQEDDTFVSLPIIKRQLPNGASSNEMNKIRNCSATKMISNEHTMRRVVKSIDFQDSKIIDLNTGARSRKRKLKNNKNNRTNKSNQNRNRNILKVDKSIDKRRKIDRKDRNFKVKRIGREANTDDEDKFYRTYKALNRDDESEQEDDYLSEERMKERPKQATAEQVMTNQEEDYHNLRIPRFEELVIRNGEVNTNYKPVKNLFNYILEQNVFRRDQIIIVDGDRLIKEPHVELNKIETFLGLPNQINRSRFVFNKKKNFYCARMTTRQFNSKYHLNGNSSSWRLESRGRIVANKMPNSNKTTGRHSSVRCLNSSKGRKHPQVDKQVISKLRQFYAPFNRHFENLVGMKFNWPEL